MRTFKPSFYSNPNETEPATLILVQPKRRAAHRSARFNPVEGSVTSSTRFKWEAPDGSVAELDGDSLMITLLAPEKYYGYQLVPGTKGYRDYVEAAIKDWGTNAGWYETYVNWPPERESLEKALVAARANVPERLMPVDKDGNPVDPPKPPNLGTQWGWYIAGGMMGVAVIGATIYYYSKNKSKVQ